MEQIRGWALIIKWKIRKTGEFGEDLGRLWVYCWLFGRNKIVPPEVELTKKDSRMH
jgi:hypothetical protein